MNLRESCTTDKLGRRSSIVKSGIFIFGLKSERNCSTGARAAKPSRPVCVAKKKAKAEPLRPDSRGATLERNDPRGINPHRRSLEIGRSATAELAVLILRGDYGRHSEPPLPLLHQLFEAATSLDPQSWLERNVACAQAAALVLARLVTAAALSAAVVVHLAGMRTCRCAHARARTLVAAVGPFAATGVDAATNVRVRQQGIFRALLIRGKRGFASGGKTRQGCQRQPRKIATIQIAAFSHFRLRQSGCFGNS